MKRSMLLLPVPILAMLALLLGGAPALPAPSSQPAYSLGEPVVYKNLAVFPITGPDRIKLKDFLTLPEALEQKKAVVEETGTVARLIIRNESEVTIYIHGGVIVKGGKQDRVIPDDYLVPPKQKLEISSFCVESGRWTQRGNEGVSSFALSLNSVSSKELKLAARSEADQGKVWSEVKNTQDKLAKSTGGEVRATSSPSSLQLSLEDKKVQQSAGEYVEAISKALAGKKEVIGYAFAVNGKINSVDIYGNGELFRRLWPQLIKATAVEALANYDKDKKVESPTVAGLQKFIEQSQQAQAQTKANAGQSSSEIRAGAASVNVRAVSKLDAAVVRENIISRE
jgi:hypothetical protein